MELWDAYDENRIPTGGVLVRGEKVPDGLYRLVVHACIFNRKNEMLIQKRTMEKDAFPGLWDLTVGGSAIRGDDSRAAIARELKEELGLEYDFSGIQPNFTVHFNHGFDDVYLIEWDVDLKDLVLQKEEVSAARWAGLDEVLDMIRAGTFIGYQEPYMRLLFHAHGRRGAFEKKK